MTRHYPDFGSASDWLKRAGTSFQPIRRTTKIWVVMRYQYGISALVTHTSFCEGSSGGLAKCRLFSQARGIQGDSTDGLSQQEDLLSPVAFEWTNLPFRV